MQGEGRGDAEGVRRVLPGRHRAAGGSPAGIQMFGNFNSTVSTIMCRTALHFTAVHCTALSTAGAAVPADQRQPVPEILPAAA